MARGLRHRRRVNPPSAKTLGRHEAAARRVTFWLPAVLAVTLALPGFGFTWLWDDFDFLGRVLVFRPSFLLPDAQTILYRPFSREVAFGAMWTFGGGSPIAGHIMNATILAAAVSVLVSLVSRLSTWRAGVLAGIAFASLSAAPLLVAWASGVQDLLAILFSLLALRLALDNRPTLSALALGAAALSKETALALLPVIACLPWIVGRQTRSPWRQLLPFLILLACWVWLTPGVRLLMQQLSSGKDAEFIGVGSGSRTTFASSMLLTLANLPSPGATVTFLAGRLGVGAIGIFLLVIGVWFSYRLKGDLGHDETNPTPRRLAGLGVLLALLPLIMTVGLVRHWSPYYSVFPAVGSSMLTGLALARFPVRFAMPLLATFLAVGIWTRGAAPGPSVPCEANLERTSAALRHVEAGFKFLRPEFPRGSLALVSVAGSGSLGVHTHMHLFQALRVWYRDPTIVTAAPQDLKLGAPAVFLFRVIPTLDVVEIDTERCLFRSSGARPEPAEISRPARSYVRAVAGLGDPIRAAGMQRRIADFDHGEIRAYDLRLAAMYLLAAGRVEEAVGALDSLQAFSRDIALLKIKKVFADATPGLAVEEFAFDAFGISRSDVEAIKTIMRLFKTDGNLTMAAHFARKAVELAGRDAECEEVLREFDLWRPTQRLTPLLDVGPF